MSDDLSESKNIGDSGKSNLDTEFDDVHPDVANVMAGDTEMKMTEADLAAIEQSTHDLQASGVITDKQVAETLAAVKEARQTFRDLPQSERSNLIRARAARGREMADSTLRGNTAVVLDVVIEHRNLTSMFLQFVPYFDRLMVNMARYGEDHFGKKNHRDRTKALTELVNAFYDKVHESKKQAELSVSKFKSDIDMNEGTYFTPTVPNPSLELTVHVHSKISMKFLQAFLELDKVLTLSSWLEWNECCTVKETNEVIRPLFRLAANAGVRTLSSYTELMRLRSQKAKKEAESQPDQAA